MMAAIPPSCPAASNRSEDAPDATPPSPPDYPISEPSIAREGELETQSQALPFRVLTYHGTANPSQGYLRDGSSTEASRRRGEDSFIPPIRNRDLSIHDPNPRAGDAVNIPHRRSSLGDRRRPAENVRGSADSDVSRAMFAEQRRAPGHRLDYPSPRPGEMGRQPRGGEEVYPHRRRAEEYPASADVGMGGAGRGVPRRDRLPSPPPSWSHVARGSGAARYAPAVEGIGAGRTIPTAVPDADTLLSMDVLMADLFEAQKALRGLKDRMKAVEREISRLRPVVWAPVLDVPTPR